ncbi:penicillin-binding protein [Patescibacteria group bacterium]|nr:penicillin-binding protein [Patescibacteria group bacterium]
MPIPHLKEPEFRIRKIGERVAKKARQKPASGPGSQSRWKKILSRWWLILGIIITVGIISIIALFAWVSRDLPDPDKIIGRTIAESTKIYANDGKTILYEIHGSENRTLVQIEDIPDHMKHATIAIEDNDFYSHPGIDLPAIMKAACHEIFGNLGGLCPQRGGSTITQQFVKNAILTSERSYTRKIKEWILAYQLEKKFSKDQILQLYFNEIPFGSTLYGVEAAAQSFFGKSIQDVTIAEAAFLAAIPQRPTYYSPYGNHTDELSNRLHLILNEMVEQGYITEEEAEEARQDNILARMNPKYENITAPHFVMYVREILSNKYGEKVIEQGGLKVTTTLNIDKQRIAEEAITAQAEKNYTNYNASNASLVCLDTKTGQILAMVGSKDYFDESIDGNVNVALRPRQPGSSFKPIVYLTAFQKGYTPETILFDLVTKFKTDTVDYEPKNYDLVEHGPVSMRQALAGSLNIPAVKTLYLAGIDNVLDNAQSLGYTTLGDRSRFGLSLVLGGGEITLLEHTSAFATLAREGLKHPVSAILKIEDNSGKILEEFEDREERVLDEKLVRTLNSVLSDNGARSYVFGSQSYLTLPDRPVAAKTGTTNDYRDAWTIGYTPSYATGVWVGNNDNSEMRRGAAGAVVAAPIWHEFMKRTVGGPVEPFNTPPANSADKPILKGDLEAETKLKIDKYTDKLIPDSCIKDFPEKFITEKTFRVVHNILHYLNKDDPNGAVPADPTVDPQYERWEEPVKRWAQENNYLEERPPEESCDLRSKKNQPTIQFTSPSNGATISNEQITIKVTAKAITPRTIDKVVYYLDDKIIGTVEKSPYALQYTIIGIKNGFHDLKAEAYDDIANTGSNTININYLLGPPTNSNSNSNNNTNSLNE